MRGSLGAPAALLGAPATVVDSIILELLLPSGAFSAKLGERVESLVCASLRVVCGVVYVYAYDLGPMRCPHVVGCV
jgi:hypothetical protein